MLSPIVIDDLARELCWQYRICGLDVTSGIELPGAVPCADPPSEPHVTIREGPLPDRLPNPSASGRDWMLAGDSFLMSSERTVRILIRNGREIIFELFPGFGSREATPYLLGPALAVLLFQRRKMVLHASGVVAHGRVVLFCGPSGAGKSTLAAACCNRGAHFFTDDVTCIGDSEGGHPVAFADGRMLKLWTSSVDALGLDGRKGGAVLSRVDKSYVAPPICSKHPALPLAVVYLLRQGDSGPIVDRLNATQAAARLMHNAYRPRILASMGLRADYFHQAIRLLQRTPVYHLERPWSLDALARTIDRLEEHWRELE